MLSFTIFVIGLVLVTCQKQFGPYRIKVEKVHLPVPKNDVAAYRFRVSKVTRDEEQVNGTIEFFRKVEDLQVGIDMWVKKRDSQADDYNLYYPRQPPQSFCCTTELIYPILRNSFYPPMNDDCSVEEGTYQIVDYKVENELRRYVGDETFYGNYKTRFFITEGATNEDIIEFDLTFNILPVKPKKKNSE